MEAAGGCSMMSAPIPFDALCGFREQAAGEPHDQDDERHFHGDSHHADQRAQRAVEQIADNQLSQSWLFALRAIADPHKLCSRRLFELEALSRDFFIQRDLRDLQVQPVVVMRAIDADRTWKRGYTSRRAAGELWLAAFSSGCQSARRTSESSRPRGPSDCIRATCKSNGRTRFRAGSPLGSRRAKPSVRSSARFRR